MIVIITEELFNTECLTVKSECISKSNTTRSSPRSSSSAPGTAPRYESITGLRLKPESEIHVFPFPPRVSLSHSPAQTDSQPSRQTHWPLCSSDLTSALHHFTVAALRLGSWAGGFSVGACQSSGAMTASHRGLSSWCTALGSRREAYFQFSVDVWFREVNRWYTLSSLLTPGGKDEHFIYVFYLWKHLLSVSAPVSFHWFQLSVFIFVPVNHFV